MGTESLREAITGGGQSPSLSRFKLQKEGLLVHLAQCDAEMGVGAQVWSRQLATLCIDEGHFSHFHPCSSGNPHGGGKHILEDEFGDVRRNKMRAF